MIEWFDDLKLGMRFKSDAVTVSKEDIIRFAAEYDPQPFHLDEEAARNTILGGLAASGWQTAAIAMRLASSCRPFGPHCLFGAGVGDLRWLKPVRPGDAIHLEGEVVELVPSRSKPNGVAPHQVDRLQPAWRAGLHLQSHRHRASASRAGRAIAAGRAPEIGLNAES
jgi:acyl dehydratase